VLRRFLDEITRRESAAESALGRLRVADGVVTRGGEGAPLAEARTIRHFADGVYESIPSRDARVALLALAKSLGARSIVLRVAIGGDRTHAARAVVDVPRRALRFLRVGVAEPGDRFGDGFVHRFFDEEELVAEIAAAGLTIASRKGATFVLERGAFPHERPDAFAVELARAARLVTVAERRRFDPPAVAVAAMRALGARHATRGVVGRARLRRAIGWLDALHPKGPSCYRRILLELALDGGAARETVVFGLDVGRTGHVAFQDSEERTFDVAFEIAP
jgi:hypothetical protein